MSRRLAHSPLLSIVILLVIHLLGVLPARALQSSSTFTAPRVIVPLLDTTSSPRSLLFSHSPVQRPRLALVLSGGGARGIAAIGVFKVLEKAGIDIDLIVGTSVGSILGGLYAAGYSTDHLHKLVDTTRWNEVLNFSDGAQRADQFLDQKIANDRSILTVRFDGFVPILPKSFSSGRRLTSYLNLLVLQGIYRATPSFDDLRIPFRAVTTDLLSGKQIILKEGDLTEAMRASASVPLLFSPVERDTTQLLDGGLISNIPVDVARREGAEIVVAVDVTSPTRPPSKLNAIWEIAEQVIGIAMQRAIEEQRAKADVLIRPDIGDIETNDFSQIDFLIRQGEAAAEAALPMIRSILEQKRSGQFERASDGCVFEHARFQFDAMTLDHRWLTRAMPVARKLTLPESDVLALVTEMYASGEFQEVTVTVTESPGSTLLQLKADPHPIFRNILFEGNSLIPTDSLNGLFEHLLGRPLNEHHVRTVIEQLLWVYREQGYSLARINQLQFDAASGSLTLRIDEGVVYRRDIRGTTKTKDYVIWRELPWDEGEVFEIEKVGQGLANVHGTNLFDQVVLGVQREEDRNVVSFSVQERSTELIRFGLFVDNERSMQPSVDLRDENLFGIGAQLGAHYSGGSRNRSAGAEFQATRVFDSYLTFNLTAYSEYRDVNVFADEHLPDPKQWNRVRIGEYRQLRHGGSATFGTQLERLGAVTVQGRLETHRVWSISGDVFPTETYKIASLKFGTTIDNLDRFPYPRNGVSMDFGYESALIRVRGGVGFTKMSLRYEAYQTYFNRNTLRPRILFGFADETLPLSEQFTLGGQETFFGLREDNARGRQLFVGSLEYRYHSPVSIFFDTYIKIRYDLGSIWATAEQIRLKDFRHGIGLTLAFDTPIGPAEFSAGQSFFFRKEILDNPVSLGPLLLYFRIGHRF